jgi:protein-S-isoprenylcysteine O-methyltransferase Ste14
LNIYVGLWTFTVKGGEFWGTPIDLAIGWAILWSTVPNVVGRRWNVFLWAFILITIDVLIMPLASPAVVLNSGWQWGELICVIFIFIPSRILAESTFLRKNLYSRSLKQLFLFFAIFIVLIPAAIVESTGGRYPDLSDYSPFHFLVLLIILFFLSLPGLSAFQEFAVRGKGTPIPMDPPKLLVCTGPYSYIANPMQTSMTVFFIVMVWALENRWFYFAGFAAVIFSIGISSWNEDADMRGRFGERWKEYRCQVRNFFPRLRPCRKQFAEIYLDFSDCDACKVL